MSYIYLVILFFKTLAVDVYV